MDAITIDDAARYKVALAAPIPFDGRKLLPRDVHRMSGETLRELTNANGWEAFASVEPLP